MPYYVGKLARGSFAVFDGDLTIAEFHNEAHAILFRAALAKAPALAVDDDAYAQLNAAVAAAATMSDDALKEHYNDFFNQAIEHRRIARAAVRGLRGAIDAFIDASAWKDAEYIAELCKGLEATLTTLRTCATNAELLRAKSAAIATMMERSAQARGPRP